jgi:hypothetical protein
MEIDFTGPYSWPKFETQTGLPLVPKHPGIYLWSVDYRYGYLIYGAGITRRTIPKRCYEHTLKFMSGDYNVLDMEAMRQGIRKQVWQGWGWNPEKREVFEKRKSDILDAVDEQLAGFRIFIADIGTEPRILERLEAAIMNRLYSQPSPLRDIPDEGMFLAPRWDSEEPIIATITCEATLHGLPEHLEI